MYAHSSQYAHLTEFHHSNLTTYIHTHYKCDSTSLPFVNGHLPALLLRLGDQLAADRACQEALLHAHQLRHTLHGGGKLLPQAEELVPVYGGPLGIHRSDLKTWGGSVTSGLNPHP